jgi:hypothetical protein
MNTDRHERRKAPPPGHDLPFELAGQSPWVRLGVGLAMLASALVSVLLVTCLIEL